MCYFWGWGGGVSKELRKQGMPCPGKLNLDCPVTDNAMLLMNFTKSYQGVGGLAPHLQTCTQSICQEIVYIYVRVCVCVCVERQFTLDKS